MNTQIGDSLATWQIEELFEAAMHAFVPLFSGVHEEIAESRLYLCRVFCVLMGTFSFLLAAHRASSKQNKNCACIDGALYVKCDDLHIALCGKNQHYCIEMGVSRLMQRTMT